MPKVNVYNMQGDQVEQIDLNEDVFGIEVNQHVVYEVVKNQLANKRQGTQSAKTRAEVRGGGRKPWRQKGTGRARAGSIRAPHWTGGGVTFAPKPRDYSYKVPKKIKRLAMKSALTSKVLENEIIVIDEFKLDAPKTKDMVNVLNKLSADRKALIVTVNPETNVIKSANNIPNVQTTVVGNLNVYDILKYNSLIITKEAVRKVEEVYA
ncbi:50S ribosomal protein L4 [Tissierella creatinophila]|uniref:Large ribosomal subunit protein uL4 n=1 Tax=Tissierella creatinophila DSM 6911 TaxID=1123403 RepID=A0A1U7M499_TISCR|nr:50S ribosomal protein L4 [Tissierella creatinophila]OLS02142.1 50S ribosomal protein L4 [Tissierella creatinophila DSM 6911]